MTPAEKRRLVELVAGLCEAFNRTPTKATFEGYTIGLEDIPLPAIEGAVRRALRELRFMPTAAELRELAGDLSSSDRAVIAWDCVLKHLHLGPYKHVSFVDDRIINATIRNMGGWPTFTSRFTDAESEKWLRKEFLDTYRSLHRAGVTGDMCAPLPGLAGGSYPDGRAYIPRLEQVRTEGVPALPAPVSRQSRAAALPHVELKRP